MESELDQLGERIAEQAAHFDAAMHRLLADLRAFDEQGGWHVQGALSCAHWLSWRVGWDLVTARERVRVARKLAEFPLIDGALRTGEVSYSKVRAMLRVATPANESLLLDHARLMTASQLEKLSRKYALVQRHDEGVRPGDDEQRRYVRRRDTADGMVRIEAVLHPEEAEQIWKMLDHAASRLQCEVAYESDSNTGSAPIHDSAESRESSAAQQAEHLVFDPVAIQDGDAISIANDAVPIAGLATSRNGESTGLSAGDSAESSIVTDVEVVAERSEPAERVRVRVRGINDAGADRRKHVGATKRGFDRADAVMWLAQQYLRGDKPNRSPIEVVLTIPRENLRSQVIAVVSGDGSPGSWPGRACADVVERAGSASGADTLEAGEIGASFVSCETARRLSCDAGVVEVVEDEHETPLSVGRKQRTIAGALKRALYRRDQTCTFPGCTHRMFLEGHHIQHWADGGETSLANTTLLCSAHHRYVHEYGYTIELVADHQPVFRDPHGRLVKMVPEAPLRIRGAAGELGWPWLRAANTSLKIDAATIACEWDGSTADYGLLVDHLMAMDQWQ